MLAVAGVLLAVVALLAIPLEVAFRLEGIEALAGRIEVGWLFGVVRFRIRVPGARREAANRSREEKTRKKRARRRPRGGRARVVAVLRQPAFRARLHRAARALLRAVRVRRFRLRMRLGLGDPADTGLLWAVLGPLSACALAAGPRRTDVRIEPDFLEAALEFRAGGRLRVVPLEILAVAVSFALSPSSLPAWRVLWSSRG